MIPPGSIKVTALIETLPAAFEMDGILYALKDHIVGLNCGRWDYIFSYIKKLRNHPQYVLPDRAQVTMDKAFLAAYVDLLIKTCHRRGAFAMGGMSAYIPVRGDEAANAIAFQKVRADKEREVRLGHDGTWVAHPGLVPLAMEVFDAGMKGPNQLGVLREDVDVSRDDLLRVPEGQITEAGVRADISIALQYLGSWLSGRGCVPINNLMEDAATAEILASPAVAVDQARCLPARWEEGDPGDGKAHDRRRGLASGGHFEGRRIALQSGARRRPPGLSGRGTVVPSLPHHPRISGAPRPRGGYDLSRRVTACDVRAHHGGWSDRPDRSSRRFPPCPRRSCGPWARILPNRF